MSKKKEEESLIPEPKILYIDTSSENRDVIFNISKMAYLAKDKGDCVHQFPTRPCFDLAATLPFL
jgi:hypothetical protein